MSRRLIVVTGATRGLGRALVDRFVEGGHVVLGCGRSVGAIQDLRQRYGPPHGFMVVDVADDHAVSVWAGGVLSEYGVPDLVVNNAALINRNAPLWQISAEEMRSIVAVNIEGVVNVIRRFVPAMVARRSGVIVNLSSGWGRSTAPEVAPYCGTKWAIEGLTKALAQELPKGMAAVALNPGIIDTAMLRSAFGDGAANYPDPNAWSRQAAPYILGLGPRENGKSATVPG